MPPISPLRLPISRSPAARPGAVGDAGSAAGGSLVRQQGQPIEAAIFIHEQGAALLCGSFAADADLVAAELLPLGVAPTNARSEPPASGRMGGSPRSIELALSNGRRVSVAVPGEVAMRAAVAGAIDVFEVDSGRPTGDGIQRGWTVGLGGLGRAAAAAVSGALLAGQTAAASVASVSATAISNPARRFAELVARGGRLMASTALGATLAVAAMHGAAAHSGHNADPHSHGPTIVGWASGAQAGPELRADPVSTALMEHAAEDLMAKLPEALQHKIVLFKASDPIGSMRAFEEAWKSSSPDARINAKAEIAGLAAGVAVSAPEAIWLDSAKRPSDPGYGCMVVPGNIPLGSFFAGFAGLTGDQTKAAFDRVGPEFFAKFLVAHEFGHCLLGFAEKADGRTDGLDGRPGMPSASAGPGSMDPANLVAINISERQGDAFATTWLATDDDARQRLEVIKAARAAGATVGADVAHDTVQAIAAAVQISVERGPAKDLEAAAVRAKEAALQGVPSPAVYLETTRAGIARALVQKVAAVQGHQQSSVGSANTDIAEVRRETAALSRLMGVDAGVLNQVAAAERAALDGLQLRSVARSAPTAGEAAIAPDLSPTIRSCYRALVQQIPPLASVSMGLGPSYGPAAVGAAGVPKPEIAGHAAGPAISFPASIGQARPGFRPYRPATLRQTQDAPTSSQPSPGGPASAAPSQQRADPKSREIPSGHLGNPEDEVRLGL